MNASVARRPAVFLALLLGTSTLVVLPACRGGVSQDADGALAAQADRASSPAPARQTASAPSLPAGVTAGMAYADLRRALLADGWLPLRDPACWDNVGGPATVCNLLPETESCSADGHCLMHFAKAPDITLRLTAYGDQADWSKPGDTGNFRLKTFDIARLDAPTGACPAGGFDAFLRSFASDDGVRRAHTAPLVRVAELEDRGDEGYFPRMVFVARDQYTGFNLKFADGGFHFVGPAGGMDRDPLRIDVKPEADGARFVSYLYNVSEGNAYRFRKAGDCWSLTEDPQPPSP